MHERRNKKKPERVKDPGLLIQEQLEMATFECGEKARELTEEHGVSDDDTGCRAAADNKRRA